MKRVITLFFLVVVVVNLKAQAPDIEWAKCYGGGAAEYCSSSVLTEDGGYILAGTSSSTNGDVTDNHGVNDYWVVKTDAQGNIQWKKSYGGSSYDWCYAINNTKDGGYILAGQSESIDGDVGVHYGELYFSDCWILKLDDAGNIKWRKILGSSLDDRAVDILQTNDGGYIMLAESESGDYDVSTHYGELYFSDFWVVKLDSSGNIEWQKTLGGSNDDIPKKILQTKENGYIVAGYSISYDYDVEGHHYGTYYEDETEFETGDAWIIKLDSNGNKQWNKSYGGTGDDWANDIIETNDNGYIFCGSTNSKDDDVTGNYGYTDAWLVKIDSVGNLQWQKNYGGSGGEGFSSIVSIAGKGYAVTGFSTSNDKDVTYNHGNSDYWIVSLDDTGNILWQKSLGGFWNEFAYTILPTNNGFTVSGYASSTDGDVSGLHTDNGSSFYGADYWIVKLNPDGTLPLSFVSFTASPQQNKVLLNWTTANETNNDYFTIERSIDDKNFASIGKVYSLGNGSYKYNFSDNFPLNGNNYYRLKQTDKDGKFTFSKVVFVSFNAQNSTIKITPNPTNGNTTLYLSSNNEKVKIKITDATGKIVWQTSTNENSITIPSTEFAAGIYNVQVISSSGVENIKFVKK